jgi:NADH:ubiquinone reductase (H+-translocating)
VKVEPDLSIPGHPEIFVIGDLASAAGEDGTPLPGLAPVAKQQGRWAAENILRTLRGEERRAFRYRDRGSMATIGRYAAIAVIGRVQLKGLLAWLAWLFVHVMSLVGFRNRVAVFMEWAWAYLTWQRGARLITGAVAPDLAPRGATLGDAGDRAPPEREEARKVAERVGGATASEGEMGWMAGDEDQAAGG